MKTKCIEIYSDPSHEWAKVSRKLIDILGLGDAISKYSYTRGDSCFLECDCDFPKFKKAIELSGVSLIIKERLQSNKSSKIRSYDSYKPSEKGVIESTSDEDASILAMAEYYSPVEY